MIHIQVVIFFLAMTTIICDLPPGTRRNAYLPPEPTKGYTYKKPPIPFPDGSRPPVGPTRPTPTFPTNPPTRPFPTPERPKSSPVYPPGPRPTIGYPLPGPKPTPGFPDYTGQPSGNNGNTISPGQHDHHDHDHHDHRDHHHEPGMPFDFNYAVKEDAFGNDYSHNAISDGDVVRGEYRVQLPDGRLQIVRYTADWKHGFNAQISYEGTPRYDLPRPSSNVNRGY